MSTNEQKRRWHGLAALVTDAVEQGASAIERVHLQTAKRPFDVLSQVPGVAEPAREVQNVHDAIVSGVYATIRAVNRTVAQTLDVALRDTDGEHASDQDGAPERDREGSQ